MKVWELIFIVWVVFLTTYATLKTKQFGFEEWLFERGSIEGMIKLYSIIVTIVLTILIIIARIDWNFLNKIL